jgi:hypothetical protein
MQHMKGSLCLSIPYWGSQEEDPIRANFRSGNWLLVQEPSVRDRGINVSFEGCDLLGITYEE